MNKSKLKAYAPLARREFIQAVTDRAHFYGLSENKKEIQPVEEKGDLAFIGGRPFPRKIANQRKALEERINRQGFSQVIEAVAYTWFNRFLALRYMEVHGYLDHGFKVLSNPNGSQIPEILEHAADVNLSGLDHKKIVELKLDGNKDAELYRMLLVAQCNALNTAMPFLFERIDDETELLLPDNLLHSDSILRKLVTEIDEEDWQQVEIIGWLYQFYISEKKDQVIGKVVKPEDIPAATQLFTPNWIVKYMVQNSLGRTWLATYPNSPIKNKMEYYIEPAEQTEEVKAQLAAITPKELNPETITFLDPASGSGHILVEAYDIFKEIYLERGYRSRDIPRLILEKNLYGLDIDDRAAQMTGFALLMKARADDRNILRENPPRLNVMAIQGSEGIDAESISKALLKEKTYSIVEGPTTLFPETITQPVLSTTQRPDIDRDDIKDLLDLFKQGKNFGSLIQVSERIDSKLKVLANLVERDIDSSDLFIQKAANTLFPFVKQAMVLVGQYHCVVANPPYMGSKVMNATLKTFAIKNYPDSKPDTFSMFMQRCLRFSKKNCYLSFVTPFVWMFISSYEKLRTRLTTSASIDSLIQLEYNAFEPACVPVCTFILHNCCLDRYKGDFIKLSDFRGHQTQAPKTLEAIQNPHCGWRYKASSEDFHWIPGSPIAYWASDRVRDIFKQGNLLGSIASIRQGMATGNNNLFVRSWYEVDFSKIGFHCLSLEDAKESRFKWFPYNKGGEFKKWYGNYESIVNWENDGDAIKSYVAKQYPYLNGNIDYVVKNRNYYFREGVTWSRISSSKFGVRYLKAGFIFDANGSVAFPEDNDVTFLLTYLVSKHSFNLMAMLNPTLTFQVGDIANLPILPNRNDSIRQQAQSIAIEAIAISETDWDSFETSWDFQTFPWLTAPLKASTMEQSWQNWHDHCNRQIKRMQELETENNRIFIEAYGLKDELTPEVPEDQITLARADRAADVKRLISYTVGCMMGRYSLDQPGLVYANSDNVGFDKARYKTFSADKDGIIPITDIEWFEDDVARRIEEFVKVAWPSETLAENLKFIADSLSPKSGETPVETIRRYLSNQFYKDHLQTYKKRPSYWLFSSGKQKAFECLVYLHRYNESTLSRMRNEYVTPLQGKFSARADYLANEINAATSTSARTKLQKQLDTLEKKQIELVAFDDLLRHYADKRIPLDLDDGVKVNYDKFGNLLAEVKAVTGGDSE